MLPAGGYLTFTATTTGINLDRDGDSAFLYNGPALVDSITFGHQVTDLTIGRIGPSGTWTLCTPTPRAANVAQRLGDPAALRINEWFTSGDVLYDGDWIELANTSNVPVALGGLTLTDNVPGDPTLHPIAPLSFIAANGFVKFIADGNPGLGATHLRFSLDAQQEQIALLNGTRTLDVIYFYPQTTDYSMGRDPSNPATYAFYELPTAGFANGTSDPGYANALALLHGLRITEIMYNAAGGNSYDFVELRNIGNTPLQIGGVKFVQGIDFTFATMTLNPGQNVVLVADLARFRERYGAVPNVAGEYLGRLDNAGETLAIQLPRPFDANILTFSYSDVWEPSTDGPGKSLVVINTLTPSNLWGDKETWDASATVGGDPDGVTIRPPTDFASWLAFFSISTMADDRDGDGLNAMIEYGLGTDPGRDGGADGAASLPQFLRAQDGRFGIRFALPENVNATDSHGRSDVSYTVEVSIDLLTWGTIATKTASTSWSGAGSITLEAATNGHVPVTVLDNTPRSPLNPLYFRLRVSVAP
jgi:hypothetical protein